MFGAILVAAGGTGIWADTKRDSNGYFNANATGYVPPSSAWVKARSITAPPPSDQEMTEAGPASEDA